MRALRNDLSPFVLMSGYAGEVRNGRCIPHQRHWLKLAELVGVSHDGTS